MSVTIELSLYPMDKNYSPYIREFIDRLKGYTEIQIKVQPMSTLISGEFDQCMSAITKELKCTMEADRIIVSTIKIINANLKDS